MKTIQETSAFKGDNRFKTPFQYLDLKKQISILLHELGDHHLHRNKVVGFATKKARANVVFQFFEDVRSSGFQIKSVLNLDQRHIKAAVAIWIGGDKPLAPATIQTRLSILRWLAASINKVGMILEPSDYGIDESMVKRSYVAKVDKSWTANDVIPEDLIAKAEEKDKLVGMHLKLMSAFGLRIRESVLIHPRDAVSGNSLHILDGTKGGRSRIIEIRTEAQRQVLDCAIQMAKANGKNSLNLPGKNATQTIERIRYVCKLFGMTKAQLGITPHGLRHQYANDRVEELTGVPTAVRGGDALTVDQELDHEARLKVSSELGHSRVSVTAAYTGSIPRRPATPSYSGLQMEDVDF